MVKSTSIKLYDLRKQLRLTQRDIARFVGISHTAWGYYETGERSPSFKTMLRIINYCKSRGINLSVEELRTS